MHGKWGYSEGGEIYRGDFATKEEAIAEGRAMAEGNFSVGQYIGFRPHIDGQYITEQLEDQAGEECGESADGWLDGVSKEKVDALSSLLNEALTAWLIESKLEPHFASVDHDTVEEIEKEVENAGPVTN